MVRNGMDYNINDGFYELLFKEDGVYLCVYPPEGDGRRLELKEVLERLARKKSGILTGARSNSRSQGRTRSR